VEGRRTFIPSYLNIHLRLGFPALRYLLVKFGGTESQCVSACCEAVVCEERGVDVTESHGEKARSKPA
jgi:hypothetical protein